MKARLRIIVAASVGLLLTGGPALAQESEPAPAQNATIGPPQLRDFSLNGTVTREAPAPAEVAPPQPRRQPVEQVAEPQRRESPAPSPARTVAERVPEQPQREPAAEAAAPTSILPQLGTPASETDVALQPDLDTPTPAAATAAETATGGLSILPWLLAALVFGGAAVWFFLRQRPRTSYAGIGAADRFEASPEPPAPRPTPPAARPAAVPAQPGGGVVSTRLRPWLEIEFEPLRAVVDDQKAAVAFRLSVFNSGSVAARDVLLEASLFNAGPQQDQQIQLFFDNPVAKGDRVPAIPPMQRMSVETAVFLQRDQVRPIEVEGRSLFVPMIAFNALYSWGRSEGQTSASYLVGKQTDGEKLAPFRLDLGSRVFRNLAAREHELRLRK